MSKQRIFLRLLKQHLECVLQEVEEFHRISHESAEISIKPHWKDTPQKAIDWYRQNAWCNAPGFEREQAAARAIDLCLVLFDIDKDSDFYYELLNDRLEVLFPGLTMPHANSKNPPVQLRLIS